MNTLEIMHQVARELIARGYKARVVEAGYISVEKYELEFRWGTDSSETWDCEVEAYDNSGVMNTTVPADSTDIDAIVKAIVEGVEMCKLEGRALHLKATDELRRVLENIDLAYDDEVDVLHVVMTLADFERLADGAKPLNDDEWASERQIAAENSFCALGLELLGRDTEEAKRFEDWALKATTEERVDYLLELVRQRLGEDQ